jgi:hypothetical protein
MIPGTLKPASRGFNAHEISTPPIPQPNLRKRELRLKSKDKFTFAANRSCKGMWPNPHEVRGMTKLSLKAVSYTGSQYWMGSVGMTVRGNNIHCSNECMETELQGCYILHVCAKELLAESERAISATVPHGHGLRQGQAQQANTMFGRCKLGCR